MSLSIVVSWRDRTELHESVPALVNVVEDLEGELLIVNFSGDSTLLHSQISVRSKHMKIIEVPKQRYFNKSRAQNVGAGFAQHSTLFFCDCDIVLTTRCVVEMLGLLANNNLAFGTIAGVSESVVNARRAKNLVCFGYTLRLRLANGRSLQIIDDEEDANTGTRQAPGLLFVKATHFHDVNGYNGRLHGWGWEDQDMVARLTLAAGLSRIQHGHVIHLSHDDQARTANYPSSSSRWESRDKMFRQALSFYDKGDLFGTYESDVAELGATVAAASSLSIS